MPRFLLAFLSIEAILQEVTIYRRRQKLNTIKNSLDLGGAFEVIMGRIKAQGGEKARIGMAVLMWISYSRRPLQVDEICHAIAIRIGSDDLDNDDIPTLSTLLDCCQGLATLDKGASTVRLVHFTLQEHLRTHPDLFDRAHSEMAEICLTYLNFQHIKNLLAGPSLNPRDAPFLEYSSLYWGTHMRMEISDRATVLALQLHCQFDSHISAKTLWKSIHDGLPFDYYSEDKPFSALHCISYFGTPEVTNTLIRMNRWDINERDSAGMTPLILAARYGLEEVVRLFVRKRHLQPDQQDGNYGRTALSWATQNGHEKIVKLLLGGENVNPDTPDTAFVQKPLSLAAARSHEGIVQLLLGQNDVNPNTPDRTYGQTPLLWASQNGHEGIVKLLLGQKDINPDTRDTAFGQTSLSLAAMKGHEGVVKLLLGRKDVNPDTLDATYGRTPLSWASQNGHEGVVELLLKRKCQPQ